MPPCLDVYVLTRERNLAVIERFVREFTSSDLDVPEGYDLLVVPSGHDGETELRTEDDFDAVHVDSLGEAVRYGLAEPRRAFWLYFSRTQPWCGAVMAFTVSDEIVLGVSVDDPNGDPQPLEDARQLMARLAEVTEARRCWIGWEEPPTLDPDRDEPWLESLA